MEVAEIEEVHIRRGIEAAQGPVQINRRGFKVDSHAL